MKALAKKIIYLNQEKKIEIVIVSGGGNIFRGTQDSKDGIDTATGHYMWMMATLMNGMAFWNILKNLGQPTKILSAIEAPRVVSTFNRNKALRYLEENKIVIATAGTGNPFCTNDLAAVIRSLELNCDMMIKATKVDGVYNKDPKKYKDAIKFDHITHQEAYERELNIMDHSAIAMAMDNKLPIFVCKIEEIEKIGDSNIIGSRVRSE